MNAPLPFSKDSNDAALYFSKNHSFTAVTFFRLGIQQLKIAYRVTTMEPKASSATCYMKRRLEQKTTYTKNVNAKKLADYSLP